jgi:cystathionine beta-lyase
MKLPNKWNDKTMRYNFDLLPDRRITESLKWDAFGEDVLPMWLADMDFISPEPVIRALRDRVEHGVFGYPTSSSSDQRGIDRLRQIIVDRMAQLYHWDINPEDLVFIPGGVTGFNLACHSQATPGGGVLVQTPVYTPILNAPGNAGILRQEMELTHCLDGSYSIDWKAFEAAITGQTRLFILCNPHNPVGRVFRKAELEIMAEICLRHGVVICSDDIHSDLIFSGSRHLPLASLDSQVAQNTITLIAPSKTYNLAGLACSIAIIQNEELRKNYQHSGKGLVGWVNLMGMVAAQAAYQDGQDWLDQLLIYLEANRDYLVQFVQEQLSGVRMGCPGGTYLAWLDCREAGIQGNPAEFFLQKGRVALNDGATFGQGGAGFVRLNFGCPRPMLTEALDRMRDALSQR